GTHRVPVTELLDRLLARALLCPVRDEDQRGLLRKALLPDALDRDAVATERLGDLGQHTGSVLDVQVEVVLAVRVIHRPQASPEARALRALHPAAVGDVPRDPDQVAD